MKKINVGILFGGVSSEHDVSCVSAKGIISNIDKEKYNLVLIGITKKGKWYLFDDDVNMLPNDKWLDSPTLKGAYISPDTSVGGVVCEDGQVIKLDVVFPVLHGKNGEDGTIQGLFELCSIPYVGCGVVASGVSMDKAYTKIIVDSLKTIPQADFVLVKAGDDQSFIEASEKKFGYPMFVKPCKSGSSQGVSKAENREELTSAVELALKHDSKVLIEECINGRELECAVFEKNGNIVCSNAGEAVAGDVFYSYEAKYNNADSKTELNPDIPEGVNEKIKEYAEAIFRILGCSGLSRIDFFMEKDGRVIFNEINTLPGFTKISMYPMMMDAIGYPIGMLMDELIDSAGFSK